MAIDNDDGSSFYDTHHNVFISAASGAGTTALRHSEVVCGVSMPVGAPLLPCSLRRQLAQVGLWRPLELPSRCVTGPLPSPFPLASPTALNPSPCQTISICSGRRASASAVRSRATRTGEGWGNAAAHCACDDCAFQMALFLLQPSPPAHPSMQVLQQPALHDGRRELRVRPDMPGRGPDGRLQQHDLEPHGGHHG